MKVLIVETNREFQHELCHLFGELGYMSSIAHNLDEAQALCHHKQFNLICIANELIDTTGLDITAAFRAGMVPDNVPIVLLTLASITEALRKKAMEVGVTEVISKQDMPYLIERMAYYAESQYMKTLAGGTVLYIEYNMVAARMNTVMLEHMGLHVIHQQTTQEVMEILATTEVDLILTDLVTDGNMSILSLVHTIRSSSSHAANIPIMILTSYDDVSRRIELYRAGINDYMLLPIIEEEFMGRVNNLIKQHKLYDAVATQHRQLHQLETRDLLTGCYNRAYLTKLLEDYCSDAADRHDAIGLIAFDVDRFKQINTDHGQAMGDEILVRISHCILQCCDGNDVVLRASADEFMVLMAPCTHGVLQTRAQTIQQKVAGLKLKKNIVATLTAGLVLVEPDNYANLATLVDSMDKVIRNARDEFGYNSIKFIDSLTSSKSRAG